MNRTWVKLGANVTPGATTVSLEEPVTGWRVGDEVIVNGTKKLARRGTYRKNGDSIGTENRRITKIDGKTLHLDQPLKLEHAGSGEFRSEVANLARNVLLRAPIRGREPAVIENAVQWVSPRSRPKFVQSDDLLLSAM